MSERTRQLGARRRQALAEQRASEPQDLDDEKAQAQILHPQTIEVTLGGTKVALHRLSGYASRGLMGLAGELFTDRSLGGGEARFRLLQPRYLARFLNLLAIAHVPAEEAAEVTPDDIDKLIKELDERTASPAGAVELATAFDAVCTQNGIVEALSAPKF